MQICIVYIVIFVLKYNLKQLYKFMLLSYKNICIKIEYLKEVDIHSKELIDQNSFIFYKAIKLRYLYIW